MSLEVAIKENTTAVLALTVALAALSGEKGGSLRAAASAGQDKSPSKAPPPAAGGTGTEKTASDTGTLDFDKHIKPIALKLLAKDKPKLAEICKKHGVEKISQVKDVAQFPAILAELNAALA